MLNTLTASLKIKHIYEYNTLRYLKKTKMWEILFKSYGGTKVGTIRKIETWHLDFALNAERQRNGTCFKQALDIFNTFFFSLNAFKTSF